MGATLRYAEGAVDFGTLVAAIKVFPTFTASVNGTDADLVVGLDGQAGHAHVELSREGKQVSLAIEILAESFHGETETPPTLNDAIRAIGRAIPHAVVSRPAIITASFTLDMRRWTPTVELPFSPPGITEKMPGLPTISGLDFAFAQVTESQPLHRAFVTTYDAIHQMVVRLMLFRDIALDERLPEFLLDLVNSQLRVLAQRRSDLPE